MRALAREVAFKKIYESLFISNNDMDSFFELENLNLDEDKEFALQLFDLYIQNKNEIEQTINSLLVDYSPERIYKIDRAILSCAIAELRFYKETPQAVVINEAVKIAKKYGTDKSYAFVNGVLKSVIKEI